eukprot:TRINITY_DN10450_c0_g1_i1.p1 TRINITY_DN10450_c0_g1~~TRINITY_DN10450_c0_g1_i1.p1  ORF type:complete len:241 (-),score=31.51 TRINITY_DN10450_c0_g1_i1:124-846(-)
MQRRAIGQCIRRTAGVKRLFARMSSPSGPARPGHIVLLGDSIFDNGVYVQPGVAVKDHLQRLVPQEWKVSLLAQDGAVTIDVINWQLAQVPADTSHIFVSAGGNDALRAQAILHRPCNNVGEAILALAEMQNQFEVVYARLIKSVLALGKPAAACTIYYPRFESKLQQTASCAGLSFFNDAIIRQTVHNKLPLLDLRDVCTAHEDYANAIEPGDAGGAKIAALIWKVVQNGQFARPEIFT